MTANIFIYVVINNDITMNIFSNILKISFIFICILLLSTACSKKEEINEYYYAVYQNMDSIPCGYQAIKINMKNGIRQQITFRYNGNNKKLSGKSTEYFKFLGNNILILNNINDSGRLFISTESIDPCVTYSTGNELHDLVASITHCYQGKKRIRFDGKRCITIHEFLKSYGMGMDKVVYRVFYDASFIPIKTERISGYSGDDLVIRSNYIPYEFDSLLNKEQDWIYFPLHKSEINNGF